MVFLCCNPHDSQNSHCNVFIVILCELVHSTALPLALNSNTRAVFHCKIGFSDSNFTSPLMAKDCKTLTGSRIFLLISFSAAYSNDSAFGYIYLVLKHLYIPKRIQPMLLFLQAIHLLPVRKQRSLLRTMQGLHCAKLLVEFFGNSVPLSFLSFFLLLSATIICNVFHVARCNRHNRRAHALALSHSCDKATFSNGQFNLVSVNHEWNIVGTNIISQHPHVGVCIIIILLAAPRFPKRHHGNKTKTNHIAAVHHVLSCLLHIQRNPVSDRSPSHTAKNGLIQERIID